MAGRDDDHAALMALAHELADQAGLAIRPYFRSGLAVEGKDTGDARFDPVTDADRAAEQAILALLAERHPDHGIVGEEFGVNGGDSPLTWIVDPIDGTRAFILGLPTWGTLIGLMDAGRPLLGVMDQPIVGDRFWGGPGGAFLSHRGGPSRRLATRACPRLAQAHLASTSPDLFATAGERAGFEAVASRVRLTRYGTDCYAYALLAAGFIDVVVEAGLKSYDVAALIPIIEAAGGRISSWDGGPAAAGGRIVAVGDPARHAELLELLAV